MNETEADTNEHQNHSIWVRVFSLTSVAGAMNHHHHRWQRPENETGLLPGDCHVRL